MPAVRMVKIYASTVSKRRLTISFTVISPEILFPVSLKTYRDAITEIMMWIRAGIYGK